MARRLFAVVFFLCCFVTDTLATRNKGVPLEYVSATFVREKIDTLQLEIRLKNRGMLDFVRLTGGCIDFLTNDSTARFFEQFMIHGFEIGTMPKENGGGLYIRLLAPTNYEGFAVAIDDKGLGSVEKVLFAFVRKEEGTVKRKDCKPKRIYPEDGNLQMISLYMVYNLGAVLGKMEIFADSRNDLLKVNAFGRVEEMGTNKKIESITSVSLYELKHNNLFVLKLPGENVRLPVAR